MVAVSEAGSTASKRTRLPFNLQWQLLEDIQAKGGLARFRLENEQALAVLCDQRKELYGDQGTKVRVRIGKKVQKWRELFVKDPVEFFGVLERFGVKTRPSKTNLETETLSDDEVPVPEPPPEPDTKKPVAVDQKQSVPVPASVDIPYAPAAPVRPVASISSTISVQTTSTRGSESMATFANTS